MHFCCPIKDLRHGFTFIELLVVISISSVLFTIGIASYNNFNESQTVEKITEELKTNIRLAQSKANNNEKPTDVSCNSNSLLGWFLEWIDITHYKMYCRCEPTTDVSTAIITLPAGVIIGSFTTIQFKPLGGTYLSNDEVIVVQGFGKHNNVTITKSGDVVSD